MAKITPALAKYAENLIALLEKAEKDNIPLWEKPWAVFGHRNFTTGNEYSTLNSFLLGISSAINEYPTSFWAGFRQCTENPYNGEIRKGEKGTIILRPVLVNKKTETGEDMINPATGKPFQVAISYNFSYVWNIAQTTCSLPKEFAAEYHSYEPDMKIEDLLTRWVDRPTTRHVGDVASYTPSKDLVTMPVMGSFKTRDDYYLTLLHEYAHSTGHSSRLARTAIVHPHNLADQKFYAAEELVAEIASAVIGRKVGLTGRASQTNSLAYLIHWAKSAPDGEVYHAAGEAVRAAEYILKGGKRDAKPDKGGNATCEVTDEGGSGSEPVAVPSAGDTTTPEGREHDERECA